MSQEEMQKETAGKSFLFYKDLLALDKESHKDAGLVASDEPFLFAKGIHIVPITLDEVQAVAANYPIVFLDKEKIVAAVLGVRPSENLLVDEAGNWMENTYVPKCVRNYPFLYVAGPQPKSIVFCFDSGSTSISLTSPEIPFFNDGELSDQVRSAMELCENYERQRSATSTAVSKLFDLDILTQRSVTLPLFDGTESAQKMSFIGVDEDKLNQLPADEFVSLRDSRLINLVYGQLFSIMNWNRLVNIAAERYI